MTISYAADRGADIINISVGSKGQSNEVKDRIQEALANKPISPLQQWQEF